MPPTTGAPIPPPITRPSRSRLLRRWQSRTRGQSLVEFALIMPISLFLFAAVLDFGRISAIQIAVANASREGAFQAAVTPTDFDPSQPCPADGKTNVILCRVQLESSGAVTIEPSDISVSCSPASCAPGIGNDVTVAVTGHFRLLTPLMAMFFDGNQDVTFSSSSTQNLETLPINVSPAPSPTPEPGGYPG